MADVFISYARENQAFAQRLAEAVRREGFVVFWDDDLPPHLSYGEVIEEKIGNARAAIVVWSKDAAASEWVRAEADLARSHKKLIQTSIDDHPLPMPFNQIQYAAIGDWNGEPDHPGWRKVRSSLAALSGREPPPVTAPPITAPPKASAPPARRRSAAVPAAFIGGLVVLAALGGGLLWMRGGAEPDGAGNALAVDRRPAAPVPASSPRAATALFTKAAVIDDPDGYSSVRSGPAETFPVIRRVSQGEIFTTYDQTSEWWQVRTADSRVGFMERSRIRLVQPHSVAEAPMQNVPGATAAASHGDAASSSLGDDPPQIFPNSSGRRLTQSEVAGLSPLQIRLARNEIFARHGRPFQDARLRQYFERYSWYSPRPGPVSLNPIEQANVRLLQRNEK